MTSITFQRPTEALLSMNDREHWAVKGRSVREWRDVTYMFAAEAGIESARPAMVCVTLDVHGNRRRDPANYFATVKPIVDGLVDAGWWPDDTPEWVTVVEPVLRVVPKGAPLLVTVELRPR